MRDLVFLVRCARTRDVVLVCEFKLEMCALVSTNEFCFEVGFPGTEAVFCVNNFIFPLNSVMAKFTCIHP